MFISELNGSRLTQGRRDAEEAENRPLCRKLRFIIERTLELKSHVTKFARARRRTREDDWLISSLL